MGKDLEKRLHPEGKLLIREYLDELEERELKPGTRLKIRDSILRYVWAGFASLLTMASLTFLGIYKVATAEAARNLQIRLDTKIIEFEKAKSDLFKSTIDVQVRAQSLLAEAQGVGEQARRQNTETESRTKIIRDQAKEIQDFLQTIQNAEVILAQLQETGNLQEDVAELIFKNEGFQERLFQTLIPLGTIVPFAGESPPTGWLICDGRSLKVIDNRVLFDVIGNSFGGESGSFQIPDLRGRVAIGKGTGRNLSHRSLGKTLGEERHRLTTREMPNHDHGWENQSGLYPGSMAEAKSVGFQKTGYAYDPSNFSSEHYSPVSAEGEGQPHNNMQPSLVVNFIIKAK